MSPMNAPSNAPLQFSETLALKAVSLLLSLILWITILGFKNEDLRKEVKFEPLVAPGMVITNRLPPVVVFTLRGPRVLLKDVERNIRPIRPDLRRTRETNIPITISEDLIGDLPPGVSVVSFQPSHLLVRLEEIVERFVPVKPTLKGLPKSGYEIGRVQITPPKVAVSGPRGALSDLDFVTTEAIDTEGLARNKEAVVTVEVDADAGFRLTREKLVRVRVRVQPSQFKR